MAEEVVESAKKGRLEEALCAFIAVEKFDEDDSDANHSQLCLSSRVRR